MNTPVVKSVAELLADGSAALSGDKIPAAVRARAEELLIDVAGLCVAARNADYVRALIAAVDHGGACNALGHGGGFSAEDAAMINGTAAHGVRRHAWAFQRLRARRER